VKHRSGAGGDGSLGGRGLLIYGALQCVLKSVTLHPHKHLEIFELEEFLPGSQNCEEWLPGLDSN
jgi:hypothetical protein